MKKIYKAWYRTPSLITGFPHKYQYVMQIIGNADSRQQITEHLRVFPHFQRWLQYPDRYFVAIGSRMSLSIYIFYGVYLTAVLPFSLFCYQLLYINWNTLMLFFLISYCGVLFKSESVISERLKNICENKLPKNFPK